MVLRSMRYWKLDILLLAHSDVMPVLEWRSSFSSGFFRNDELGRSLSDAETALIEISLLNMLSLQAS